MIFVTVGTHEQPFDRLLRYIDKMIENGIIKEEVVVQKGYTDYEPKNYKAKKLISYDEKIKKMNKVNFSNNEKFCGEITNIVNNLFDK